MHSGSKIDKTKQKKAKKIDSDRIRTCEAETICFLGIPINHSGTLPTLVKKIGEKLYYISIAEWILYSESFKVLPFCR